MHNSHSLQQKLLGIGHSVCWIKLPILKVLSYLEYFIKNLFVVETNWDLFLLGVSCQR